MFKMNGAMLRNFRLTIYRTLNVCAWACDDELMSCQAYIIHVKYIPSQLPSDSCHQ